MSTERSRVTSNVGSELTIRIQSQNLTSGSSTARSSNNISILDGIGQTHLVDSRRNVSELAPSQAIDVGRIMSMRSSRESGSRLTIQRSGIASDGRSQLAVRTDRQDLARVLDRSIGNNVSLGNIGTSEVRLVSNVRPCNSTSGTKRNLLDALRIISSTELGLVRYIVHLCRSLVSNGILNLSYADPVVLVDRLAREPIRRSKLFQICSGEYLFLSARRDSTQRKNARNRSRAEINRRDVSSLMSMRLSCIQICEVRLAGDIIPGQILDISKNLTIVGNSTSLSSLGELLIQSHCSVDILDSRGRLVSDIVPRHLRDIGFSIERYLAQSLGRGNQVQVIVIARRSLDADRSTRLYIVGVQGDIRFRRSGRIEYQITTNFLQGHILADDIQGEVYAIIRRRRRRHGAVSNSQNLASICVRAFLINVRFGIFFGVKYASRIQREVTSARIHLQGTEDLIRVSLDIGQSCHSSSSSFLR